MLLSTGGGRVGTAERPLFGVEGGAVASAVPAAPAAGAAAGTGAGGATVAVLAVLGATVVVPWVGADALVLPAAAASTAA